MGSWPWPSGIERTIPGSVARAGTTIRIVQVTPVLPFVSWVSIGRAEERSGRAGAGSLSAKDLTGAPPNCRGATWKD
jgi:hypothetical protein